MLAHRGELVSFAWAPTVGVPGLPAAKKAQGRKENSAGVTLHGSPRERKKQKKGSTTKRVACAFSNVRVRGASVEERKKRRRR